MLKVFLQCLAYLKLLQREFFFLAVVVLFLSLILHGNYNTWLQRPTSAESFASC